MEAVADRPSNQYNGPTQITGSYNSAGRDSAIEANGPKMDQSTRTDSEGCSNGNCAGEQPEDGEEAEGAFNLQNCLDTSPGGTINGSPAWVPGCSCSSHAAGHC